MDRFGDELAWITNPDSVGIEDLGDVTGTTLPEQCFYLAEWMVNNIAQWTARTQSKINWAAIFGKYNPPIDYRVAIRDKARIKGANVYSPGILAMSEMVAVTPYIAARDGAPKAAWEEIAAESRKFGAAISRDGTDFQLLIRKYLHSDEKSERVPALEFLDPAKLKMDAETGLTTVTPLETMMAITRARFNKRRNPADDPHSSGVCVALQAKAPTTCEHARTMFDATWLAYTSIAARLIFPNFEVDPKTVPAQEEPDKNFEAAVNVGIDWIQKEYYD